MTLFAVLCTLALSGCFDDAVTVGLGCENDVECGEGQACGPGVLEDNGSPTPNQVCGIAQDEGWDACQDNDRTICGGDFETALVCRNGFRTETDCDVVCEAQVGERNDGVCGDLVPETDADCACAYAIDELPDGAKDCLESEAGLDVVRSTSFGSDDVAVYLQTCDEWCKLQSEIPMYQGSVCAESFRELAAEAVGDAFAAAVGNRLRDDQRCVCRLAQEPDCTGDPPPTQCLGSSSGTAAVALCTEQSSALIQCSNGCGRLGVGTVEFDWCL